MFEAQGSTVVGNLNHAISARKLVGHFAHAVPSPMCFQRSRTETDYAEFSWTTKEQGLILSGFSFGYVTTQVLGGYLAQIYGGKWVVGLSNLGCGLVSVALPWIARVDPGSAWPMFFTRVLEGALQAPIWPGTYSLVGKWIPAAEKPSLMAAISSGEIELRSSILHNKKLCAHG